MRVFAILLFCAAIPSVRGQGFETITAKDGRRIEGEVLAPLEDHLQVRRADGHHVNIPWEMLELDDQAKYRTLGMVSTKYDRFIGATTVRLIDNFKLDDQVEMGAAIYTINTVEARADRAMLHWIRVADAFEWSRYSPVIFLLDGVRWEPRSEIEIDLLKSGQAYESLTIQFSPELLKPLLKAKEVEMRIGRREYTLTQLQQWYIRAVASAWIDTGGDPAVVEPLTSGK